MVRFVLILLLFPTLLVQCRFKQPVGEQGSTTADENRVHEVNILDAFENKGELMLADIAADIEYIPLETLKSCFIKRIDQLFVTSNYFVISDRHRCYLFDRSGKFVRHIGRVGKGPGEHLLIRTIDVDNNYVYINANGKNHILKYTFQGEYVGSIGNEIDVVGIVSLDTTHFLLNIENYWGKADSMYTVLNLNNEFVHSFRNYLHFSYSDANGGTVLSRNNRSFFVRSESRIFAKPFFNDTIYQVVSPKELAPKFIFNCGNMQLPRELLGINYKHFSQGAKYIVPSDITLNSRFLFVELEHNKKKYGGLYSSSSQKTYVVCPTESLPYGFTNNLDGGLPFWPITTYGSDRLVGFIYPYLAHEKVDDLKSMPIKNANAEKHEKFIRVAKGAAIDSNPILVIVKIKGDSAL